MGMMKRGWGDILSFIVWDVYLSLVGLFLLLLLLISLIFFIPTFIWRPISRYLLRPHFRPDLADILSCTSSVFAQVDEHNYAKTVMVLQATFKGVLDYEKTLERIQEQWIEVKDKEGNIRYPQLQQYICEWVGYKWWKWETAFSLRHHVHLIKDHNHSKTPEDLHEIGRNLLCGSFPEGHSPWDYTLVPGVIIDGQLSTLMYFRAHHALADGYSLLFLVQRLLGTEEPHPPHRPRFASLSLGYFLRLPYRVLRLLGELAHNTASPFLWKIPEEDKSPLWSYSVGSPIPISSILQIKRHFNVSFTAVVFALICGGISRFILKNERGRGGIKTLPAVFSTPIKYHPDELSNKFSFAMTSYPVGIPDPVERLEILHQNFEGLRDSPVPIIGYWALRLHGSHFNGVGKYLNSYRYAPFIATYFPCGSPSWSIQGSPVTQITFYLRLQQGQQGAMFSISTFHSSLQVTPVFNAALLSDAQVAQLCGDIEKEAQVLLHATKINDNKKLV